MPIVIDRRISFSGGEVSPWTDPRIDLEKYRSSCRECENFKPNVYGGAFNRPGTIFLGEAYDMENPVRLVGFEYSVTTTLVMEFGHEYIRFWTTGETPSVIEDPQDIGNPLIVETPWSSEHLNDLHFAQQNDLVVITHPLFRTHVLTRVATDDWSFVPMPEEWPASLDENITMIEMSITGGDAPDTYPAWTALFSYPVGDRVSYNGVNYRKIFTDRSYLVVFKPPGTYTNWDLYWAVVDLNVLYNIGQTVQLHSSEPFFDAGHVGSTWVIKHRREDPSTSVKLSEPEDTVSDPLMVLGEWSCNVVVNVGGTWEVRAVVERSYDKDAWETIRTLTSSGINSDAITGTEIDPCWLRIRISFTEGAPPTSGSFTLEAVDAFHYGLLYITDFVDDEELVARVVFPPYDDAPTKYWNEPAWSDYRGFPRSVTFHENRLMLGGSAFRPQTVWGSVIDDYFNFRVSSDDDSGLSLRLASDAANGIQYLVSQKSLVVGTTGSEWVIGDRDSDKPLTPTGSAAKRDTQYGSVHIQAQAIGDATLFVQRSGRKVREFAWTFENDGYTAQDLTLLAEHIADASIVQVTTQRIPDTILWCVTSEGELLGLLYDRAQSVAGWFRYTTGQRSTDPEENDRFESIDWVSGEEEDEGWVSVVRVIDGVQKRFIERFQPNTIRKLKDNDQPDVCYLDSARIRTGAATATIDELDHLNGMEVGVLGNGAPEASKTVSGGEITTDNENTTTVVGLPYESRISPTFFETNDPSSLSKVGKKLIKKVNIEVWRSGGGEVTANNGTKWDSLEFRAPGDLMDSAVPWFTGIREDMPLQSSSARQSAVIIRQTQPLPFNLLSLHTKYELNDPD